MVSILGEYYYEFPKPFPLEKRLKDYLEESVDEKYYLSEKAIEGVKNTSFNSSSEEALLQDIDDVCGTLCARDYKGAKCVVDQFGRTRRLTPNEYFRLQGINYTDFNKVAQVCSPTRLYQQSGNGIAIDVFAKIIEQMKEENI